MKSILLPIMMTLSVLCVHASIPSEDSILGIWNAPDLENMRIEIYKAEDGYIYGKIIESEEESWIDKIILKQVTYDPAQKSWKGQIYSLKVLMTVDVVLTLEDQHTLKLVGSRFWMTKTFFWKR